METSYSKEIIKDISRKIIQKMDTASNTNYSKSAQTSSPASPVQKDNLSTSEANTNVPPKGMSEQENSTISQNLTNNPDLINDPNLTNKSNSTDDAISMAINFNSNSIVQGFIMSEILGSPKAKRWRGNTLWNSRF